MRVAFAGLSALTEEILLAALGRRPDIEVVTPWTRLASLSCAGDVPEMLLVQLDGPALPAALRVMLWAAPQLRIVGLAPDNRSATIFFVGEQRTVIFDYGPEELCALVNSIH